MKPISFVLAKWFVNYLNYLKMFYWVQCLHYIMKLTLFSFYQTLIKKGITLVVCHDCFYEETFFISFTLCSDSFNKTYEIPFLPIKF